MEPFTEIKETEGRKKWSKIEFLFGHVIFEISMKHLGEAISRQLDK